MRSGVAGEGNVPSANELAFVRAFFEERLTLFESEAASVIDRHILIERRQQAICMQQSLRDLASPDGGNYVALGRILNDTLDVDARIDHFLAATSMSRHLMPSGFPPSMTPPPAVPTWPLLTSVYERPFETFLCDLLEESNDVDDPDLQAPPWRHFTAICERLLDYMEFLFRTAATGQPPRFVFLLRDTLLLYTGMRRAQKHGWCAEPSAMLVNRAVIRSFAPNWLRDGLYASIFNLLYVSIGAPPQTFDASFVTRHARVLREDASGERLALLEFIERYCARELRSDGYIAVETGVHGTLPLLLMAVTRRIVDLRLYTAVPWLHSFFGGVVHTKNSAYMREIEALACQEALFQFSRISEGRLFVKETRLNAVRRVACQEVRAFGQAVAQRFPPIGVHPDGQKGS